jgi:hypothetical protein
MTDQQLPEDDAPVTPAQVAPKSGPSELPFIDDSVSKWWIGIVIAVFTLIFAYAILLGGNGLLSGVFESEEATPSPEPGLAASPSPDASPDVSMAPVAASIEPTPEPTAEPSEEPSLEPCGPPDPDASLLPGESPEPTPACYTPEPSEEPSAVPEA